MPNEQPHTRTDRLVIGVAGRIGAGKTSAATHLNAKHGFQYIRYSQILAQWHTSDPAAKGRLQEIGWEVMSGGLQPELNRRLIAQIKPDVDVVVDGLRHPIDRTTLKDRYNDEFRLVYIECLPDIRWHHVKEHGKYADFASFQARDSHPVEQHIDALRSGAHRVLANNGSLDALYRQIDDVVATFRKEGRA
jgi:dephospho-CoA kinase